MRRGEIAESLDPSRTAASTPRRCRSQSDDRAGERRGAGAARHPDGTGPRDSLQGHRPRPGRRGPCRMALHFGRELNATEDRPHFTGRGDPPIVEGNSCGHRRHAVLPPFGFGGKRRQPCWIRERPSGATVWPIATSPRRPTGRLIAAIVPRDMVTRTPFLRQGGAGRRGATVPVRHPEQLRGQ